LKERKVLPEPCYLELIKYMSMKLSEKLDVELVEIRNVLRLTVLWRRRRRKCLRCGTGNRVKCNELRIRRA
jgi:hypothetical protein